MLGHLWRFICLQAIGAINVINLLFHIGLRCICIVCIVIFFFNFTYYVYMRHCTI